MANPRVLDKRRKAIRNIRKITRTMELIATARFKKAMDRAHSATAYTRQITRLVADLAQSGLEVTHPLLESRDETNTALLLVLTGNRGLCGGFNGNAQRLGYRRLTELKEQIPNVLLEVSGKRGIGAFKYRKADIDQSYTHFEDKPSYEEVQELADRYLELFVTGQIDRLDVAYTKFINPAKQTAVVETLLPLGTLEGTDEDEQGSANVQYDFLPSAESILEEVVPTSFKVKLFKCFLDSAVSEQIARMVAMKAATENADGLIKSLTRTYNRARQSQITNDILEVLGGAEALKN